MISPATSPFRKTSEPAQTDGLSQSDMSPFRLQVMPDTPDTETPPVSPLLCTPHIVSVQSSPMIFRRRAVRRARRHAGRQSRTPHARRRLVFEVEREE